MDKIDYIRGKEITYETVQGDKLTIEQKTNGELIDLVEDFQDEWDEAKEVEMSEQNFVKIIQDKPAKFLNQMVAEEIDREYFLNNLMPNDIYNIVRAFKEVNFTFLRSLMSKKNQVLGTISQLTRNMKQENPTKK